MSVRLSVPPRVVASLTTLFLAGCPQTAGVAPPEEPEASGQQAPAPLQADTPPEAEASAPSESDGVPVVRFVPATEEQTQLLQLGFQNLRTGEADRGVMALISLTETAEPSEVRAQGAVILADYYIRTGNLPRARTVLNDLRQSSPPLAQLEYLAGMVADEPTEAEAAFRQALRIDSTYLPSYTALIVWYNENGRTEEGSEVQLRLEREVYRIGERLDEAADADEKVGLIERLASVPPSLASTQSLVRALDDENIEVVAHAAAALGEMGMAEAVAPLRTAAENARIEELRALINDAIAAIEARSSGAD
jgi:tetratricopeptide (TPR) repeat protein